MKKNSNYHDGKRNTECYFCGCGPPLEEHHVIPRRFGGPDTKDNIVELCQLCHQRLEKLYDKSFYEWFGINDNSGERKFHRPCQNYECENQAEVKINGLATTVRQQLLCRDHAISEIVDDFITRVREAKVVERREHPGDISDHWNKCIIAEKDGLKYEKKLQRTLAIRAMGVEKRDSR